MRLLIVVALSLLASVAGAQEELSYGDHPQQKLDVYRNLASDKLGQPGVVVMVHGGGFARGDKRRPYGTLLFEHIREVLIQTGHTVVGINYRLAADTINNPPQHPYDFKYPTAHEDVVAAVRWVSANVGWPIVVIGESAGGNLGTHLALHPELGVVGYVDIGGYQNLPAARSPTVLAVAANYLGCSLQSCPKLWAEASPTLHVDRQLPMLLWHGDNDYVVEFGQTYGLAKAMTDYAEQSSSPAALVTTRIVRGAGHTGLPGYAVPERDAELVAFVDSCVAPAVGE